MRLISWNMQSGKGCDGITDIYRISEHIKTLGDFDVICLQEVACNMEAYCAHGQMNQVEILSNAFDSFSTIWGTGFCWPIADSDKTQEFGNLTLIRNAPLDHKTHQLPMPAVAGQKQMPRVAVETVVSSNIGPLSIINTHLAYHDDSERQQQLERINLLERERKAQRLHPKKNDNGAYQIGPASLARILCGDFNFEIKDSEYEYQTNNQWIDAWVTSNMGEVHSPTCGIFDLLQWPQGAHCRDYFWLSNELSAIKFNMQVDTDTALSDHQPIMLEIEI